MSKLLVISALASAGILLAVAFSPVSAAPLTTNLSVGRVSAGHVSAGNFGNVGVGSSGEHIPGQPAGTSHSDKYKGPVVTDEGGCHTKATSLQRCYP